MGETADGGGRYTAMEGDDKYRVEAFDEWSAAKANQEALEKEAQRQVPRPRPSARCRRGGRP